MSIASTVLPICFTDSFKPMRARAVGGKTELLPGLDIVRKLDITVVFGIDHFRVGHGELEMVTCNEKHQWVLPLPPNCLRIRKTGWVFFGNAENRKL